MARNNDNKMLQAVLLDETLMKFGDYSPSDISTIEGASEKELWKEIDKYLIDNV